MDKKTIIWIVAAVVVVVALGIVVSQKGNTPATNKKGVASSSTVPMYNGAPVSDVYKTEVPKNATVTEAQTVVPASADKTLTTSARTIVMKVSQSGFDPSTITVNQWDRVELLFSPQDNNYDFSIPYLGTHFFTVKKGEQKKIAFELPTSGTFVFECTDACPASGKIKGEIVVIPKSAK
jgi:plastocyanin